MGLYPSKNRFNQLLKTNKTQTNVNTRKACADSCLMPANWCEQAKLHGFWEGGNNLIPKWKPPRLPCRIILFWRVPIYNYFILFYFFSHSLGAFACVFHLLPSVLLGSIETQEKEERFYAKLLIAFVCNEIIQYSSDYGL